jgi:hypothetical protein
VINGILVAFCAFEDISSDTRDTIVESVNKTSRKWLPAYMVPGDVVVTKKLPYLASGKLDRKQLRETYIAQQESQTSDNSTQEDPEMRYVTPDLATQLFIGFTNAHALETYWKSLAACLAPRSSRLHNYPPLALTR